MNNNALIAILIATLFIWTGCDEDDAPTPDAPLNNKVTIDASGDVQDQAQTALIEMENGDTIYFPAGSYSFTNTLSVEGKDSIVILGDGRTTTTLSFAGQTSGAEGLKVDNCDRVQILNITVADALGDAVKTKDCNGISFINVGTVWTGTPSKDNGAYGLYPVLCNDVLIDGCYAYGASDAGIYVGQTNRAIVRNSIAEGNVAGIEIENTIDADVYGNTAKDNTGGILIFDLPGLTQYGKNCRVYDNVIENNSRANFAPAGNIVANVPSGTGIMILSTADVEVFNNTITNNNLMGFGIVNYLVLTAFGESVPTDPNYETTPSNIYIHDNTFSRTEQLPTSLGLVGIAISSNYPNGGIDDILVAGELDSVSTNGLLCIQNNTGSSFANLDVENGFTNPSFDANRHDCVGTVLPAITVDAP